jgi:hypothetical protein
MSGVGDQQRLFFHLFVQWANWAEAQGYQFTWGEAFRSDEQAEINAMGQASRERVAALVIRWFPKFAHALINNGKHNGIRRTAHGNRMAVDLNAFKNGIYLTKTEQWQELGEYWESLHPLCRWGGRFGDGNHLSIEHDGIK